MDPASHLRAVTIMMSFKVQFFIAKTLCLVEFLSSVPAQSIIWVSSGYDCELQFRCLQYIIYNITEHSVQSERKNHKSLLPNIIFALFHLLKIYLTSWDQGYNISNLSFSYQAKSKLLIFTGLAAD